MIFLGNNKIFEIKLGKNNTYTNSRFGDIYFNGKMIREIYPEVLLDFNLEFPASAFKLNLQNLQNYEDNLKQK